MSRKASGWANRIVGQDTVPASSLLANEKNWRIHPGPQQSALSGVLSDVGWVQQVIVNRRTSEAWNGSRGVETLVDGHLRVTLALRQGDDTPVPVLYVDLDPAEEAEVLATLDPIAAMASADAEKLDALLRDVQTGDAAVQAMLADLAKEAGLYQDRKGGEDNPPNVDKAAELQAKWQTARGQVWVAGRHRLMCGDSTVQADVDRLMDGEKAEMVWTDPPYGVAVGDKNKYLNSIARSNRVEENLTNDTLDEPELLAMLRQAFDCAIGVCLAGAAWYVAAPPGPLHVLFGQVLKERRIWRQTIQWVKNNATFAPLGTDYHWRAEPIFYGWVPNAGHRYYGGRKQDTVWEIDRPAKSPEHPTMKPVEVVQRAIENSSLSGQIVLDPFLGSGTTLVAAENAQRSGRGMEIDEGYTAVCLERLSGLGLEPRLCDA